MMGESSQLAGVCDDSGCLARTVAVDDVDPCY
jgi:hypothetical protein